MKTYRERLSAPLSWWLAALAFAFVWGWLFLVATNWPIAITVAVLVAAAGIAIVARYGSLLITVGPEGLRVGRAFVDAEHIGGATALDRVGYRTRLGTGADARAYLATRPYLDHGVVVTIDDPSDPAPYWLVSSRHPVAFAAALARPGAAPDEPVHDTNGAAPRGEEEA